MTVDTFDPSQTLRSPALREFRTGVVRDRWESFLEELDAYLDSPTPERRDEVLIRLGEVIALCQVGLLHVSEDFITAAMYALATRRL